MENTIGKVVKVELPLWKAEELKDVQEKHRKRLKFARIIKSRGNTGRDCLAFRERGVFRVISGSLGQSKRSHLRGFETPN
jgi:hypothetical protein